MGELWGVKIVRGVEKYKVYYHILFGCAHFLSGISPYNPVRIYSPHLSQI